MRYVTYHMCQKENPHLINKFLIFLNGQEDFKISFRLHQDVLFSQTAKIAEHEVSELIRGLKLFNFLVSSFHFVQVCFLNRDFHFCRVRDFQRYLVETIRIQPTSAQRKTEC